MSGEFKIEPVTREVIQKRLLASLDDEDKVALLLSKTELDLLIAALTLMDVRESKTMAKDLTQLRVAAFTGA